MIVKRLFKTTRWKRGVVHSIKIESIWIGYFLFGLIPLYIKQIDRKES